VLTRLFDSQTELHQEHLTREKRLEEQLASEKHHAQTLRSHNVQLKEKVDQMLQVMKAACASDKESVHEEEVRWCACSTQRRTPLVLTDAFFAELRRLTWRH
jgi:hypothetical protein